MEGSGRDRWKPVQNTQSQEHTAVASSYNRVGVQGRLTLAKPAGNQRKKGSKLTYNKNKNSYHNNPYISASGKVGGEPMEAVGMNEI